MIDYRIAVNGDTLAAGADVPSGDLTEQFNEQVHRNSVAIAAIARSG